MADLDKLVEELSNLTVMEAAELSKKLEEHWGVSAAAPVAAGGGGGEAAAPAEEKTEFDVVLTAPGDKKINVIKEVRGITGLGLKEAKEMVENLPTTRRVTLAGDRGYDVPHFVAGLRERLATPHLAQKSKGTAIDSRTTRHAGYQVSLRIRKRVEEIFGWLKTIGCLRKTRHRGLDLVGWMFEFSLTAYNLIRMRNLIWGT